MNRNIWGDNETKFFYELTPDTILNAIDTIGLETTGRCLTLNSMENRVYEIEIYIDESKRKAASDSFVVAKFYRPGRWSKEQILEEHAFLLELDEEEVPVIPPIICNGETLFRLEEQNLWYCIFPKRGGRAPVEMSDTELQILGRQTARMHTVGASKKALHRLELSLDNFANKNLEYLLESNSIPMHFENQYKNLVSEIIQATQPYFNNCKTQRIHGDCHWGNVISRGEEGMFFIDFDDMLVGPCIQDLWLIIAQGDDEGRRQRDVLLEAYESMKHFDDNELRLIEPLRALRYIHFSSWISKRWEDQAFKNAFPEYGSDSYWQIQVNDLQDQLEKF